MNARRLALALTAAGLLAAGAGPPTAGPVAWAQSGTSPASVTPVPTPDGPPDAAAGRNIYAEQCVRCHGSLGRGDGELLAELPGRRPGRPPSFADPDYIRAVTPALTYDVITHGRIELGMPPWSEALSAAERWNALHGAWSFYYTSERLVRGRLAWSAACASCHGPDGAQLAAVPLADTAYMASRSQADLFAATRQAPEGHEDLKALPDDDLWAALDYARSFTYRAPDLAGLALGGRIAGRLDHGTAGATGPLSATVRLVPVGRLAPGAPVTATVGADGAFAFDDLVVGPGARYALVTRYQGVDALMSEPLELTADVPMVADLRLPVHEPATDVPVTMRTGHIVVAPDPVAGVVRVAEVWVIQNATDQVLVAPDGGATIRFPLPPGLREIRLEDERMRQADRMDGDTLVDTLPVPPGERQVVISYDIPYTGTAARIERVVPLDTAELRVLATGNGVALDSATLPERDTTTVQGEPVQQAVGRDLAAGANVPIQLTGLPRSSGAASADLAPGATGLVGQRSLAWLGVLLGLMGLAVVLLYPRVAGGMAGTALAARLAGDRAELVAQIAALDRARAAGQVAEAEHAVRRAALLDRALAVARQQENQIGGNA